MKICVTLIAISHYLKAKFDYGYFIIFFALWFQDSTKKSPFIWTKNEGVMEIFATFFLHFLSKFKVQPHWGLKAPCRGLKGP